MPSCLYTSPQTGISRGPCALTKFRPSIYRAIFSIGNVVTFLRLLICVVVGWSLGHHHVLVSISAVSDDERLTFLRAPLINPRVIGFKGKFSHQISWNHFNSAIKIPPKVSRRYFMKCTNISHQFQISQPYVPQPSNFSSVNIDPENTNGQLIATAITHNKSTIHHLH